MTTFLYIVIAYLIFINVYGFILMGQDKSKAKRRARRVPEKHFFLISAVGGALGTWYGMKKWRHKTQHRTFTIGIPLLLVVNISVIAAMIWYW
ncbi:DUF1294 domain-containing protein [Paenibacillus sp. GSMTC-2017]|uniref:DUF1294 domain-containing protein n=1 Tax=Paenibacillus sp. GSMTC-2017 TaxID=2794350 RepID=UPI0018D6DC57|nr:DUF1294 domain-containing protein [Paenibacillus sp. GSMTC-2017]MBH5316474.1 DUF1294 domain-containing protein [Paenibacillus sp. GSMTC-2017]